MITVSFYVKKDTVGFEMSGHSGYAEEGSDIICSAVSSCAYMTANTATEILGLNPEIKVKDGYMKLIFNDAEALKAKDILNGFRLHMNALADEYPEYIDCKTRNI
ncbi:MAG: ribosomal-processing cysteine protease Prp [Acutalibacteraceae bacterium]